MDKPAIISEATVRKIVTVNSPSMQFAPHSKPLQRIARVCSMSSSTAAS